MYKKVPQHLCLLVGILKTENQEEGRQMGELLLTTELTAHEIEKLEHCEQAISSSVDAMGSALTTIRDDRLYRAEHPTFEEYLKKRWNMERRQAYRLIDAYRVRRALVEKCVQMDTNVAQCRELASVKPDSLVAVVETAQQIALARGATKIASADIRSAKNIQSQTVNAESVVKVVENPKCVQMDTNVARPTEKPSLRLPDGSVGWDCSDNENGRYDSYDAIRLLTRGTGHELAGFAVGSILIHSLGHDDLAKWIVLGMQSCESYTNPKFVESQLQEVIRQYMGEAAKAVRPESKAKPKPDTSDAIKEAFEHWYRIYPRKVAKLPAGKAYPKAIDAITKSEKVDTAKAIALLVQWTQDRLPNLKGAKTQFIPYPSTWLNEQRYRDEIENPSSYNRSNRPGANVGPRPGKKYDPTHPYKKYAESEE